MDVGETLLVRTQGVWHRWLARHHASSKEIWTVNFKKGSTRLSLSYEETLDEAVCFGWIDGLVKRKDAEAYVQRWTPRRAGGNWTQGNRERGLRLAREGRMTPAGITAMPPDLREAVTAIQNGSAARRRRTSAPGPGRA
ncbi:MAG: hypothetical protein L3J96_01850 [Thermoplasmata archaeon]|nr:hypothetical protein [Thermoplasmata archaeon]